MFQDAIIRDFPEDADFSNVVDGTKMFYNATIGFNGAAGNEFKLKNFRSVERAERMFMCCKSGNGSYVKFDLDQIDIRHVKIADHMFANAYI